MTIITSMTVGALLLLSILGIAFSAFAPALDRWNRRYLIFLFCLQLLCLVLSLVDAFIYADHNLAILDKIINFFVFFFMMVMMVLPTVFLVHHCGVSYKKSWLFKAVLALALVYVIMLIVTQFTDVFYTVTTEQTFTRGPLFPLLLSPIVAIVVIPLVAAFVQRKKLRRSYFVAFLVYLPPMTATLAVHMFFFFELYIFLAIGLWAITILAIVAKENGEHFMRQQREIASQRASIMVLQMRPHFIYNTMTSIYYLCDQDPEKAKQVTLDFTMYLRKNFAALAREGLIPFGEELEHTKAYLSVEQAQFEDGLKVDFDTQYLSFHLPPLTLQPIVENAVKHGLRKSDATIHISIITRKTEEGCQIIVEDDGPGFQPSDDDEPHIALDNIKERLRMMCKGSLTISPRDGGGTAVKVTIPLK